MNPSPRRVRFRALVLGLLFLAVTALLLRPHRPAHMEKSNVAAVAARPAPSAPAQAPSPVQSSTPPSTPATIARRALFSYVTPPVGAAALEARLPAPTNQMHYIRLDREWIGGKSSPFWQQPGEGSFEVPLPDGRVVTVAIAHSEMVGAGRFTSTGVIAGRETNSHAVFAYDAKEGIMHATVEDLELGTYTLRYGDGDVSQFFEVDPKQLGSCAGGISASLDPDALAIKANYIAARRQAIASGAVTDSEAPGAGSTPPTAEAIGPTNAEVHLLMCYTQDVLSAVGSAAAVQNAFDAAVATVNADFARSQITTRIKLVKTSLVTYDETISASDKVQSDALVAMASGKVPGVYALRDQVGADLVNLIILRANPSGGGQVAGIGYLMDSPSVVDTSAWEFNSLYGFSVVRYVFVNSQHVLSHELGHNFGCAHDRDNAKDSSGALSPGAYSYSYGYRVTGKNGLSYHDIMAYDPPTLLPYFSNPDVTPTEAGVGVPFGVGGGLVGESDTALTIEKDAYEVSMFRLQQQVPANRGTLVNVATLAYVGTGDQQLIGGFVINGAQPKTVMVRAVGPGLAQLGVTGFLTNPTLKLNRTSGGTVEVARNDDWGTPQNGGASAGTLAAAALQVGAFALPNGSLDAVVLTTLPGTTGPVPYTVNIEGSVAGQTGTALVEAYEVGANSTKVINLATRGYMAADKPMVAGFVIVGNPGETKRVLIRVRGPSLAAFGLVGANDPIMSLYNSSQQLLIVNDDFSADSPRSNSPTSTDSDSPVINSYAESAILATGYAPSNRREPCVLVDLAPGAYTVIATPFQSLSSTPPQPAAPGIAVIEVFEIN